MPLAHASDSVLSLDLADRVRSHSWFVSGRTRGLVDVGLQYFIPNYFHQIPRLCQDYMKIDYTVTTVSPMDNAGYFSFGTANDFTSTAARHGKLSRFLCERTVGHCQERPDDLDKLNH
jgi:itaconate CoA-transferase